MSPVFALALAVLAVTYAAPVIRFATAPALAIAFWRLALVLPVTLALAWREPREAHEDERRGGTLALMALAGTLLAIHFWSWIASLRFTTVASSVLLVNLRPLFVWAIAALWLGEHPGRRERWGIGLAVLGATLIGVGDARLSFGALGGDLLAVTGALAAAGYSVIGRRVRQHRGVWRYVTPVYATAALVTGDRPATERPHWWQNLLPSGLAALHAGHGTSRRAPHSPQNLTPAGFCLRHRGHSMRRNPLLSLRSEIGRMRAR